MLKLCLVESEYHLIFLRDKEEREKSDFMDNRVTISTMFLVKGLEYENVYLMGLENFSWSKRNIRENDSYIYVGTTRAKTGLILHSTIEREYTTKMRGYLKEALQHSTYSILANSVILITIFISR